MCHAFLHTCIIVFLPNLNETGSSTLKWLAFYTCLTFSPSWINEGFSLNKEIMWEKIAMRRRDTCSTSGLKLPQARFFFFLLPSSLCRREIERRGERRRPQVTFLDYQLNAWGEWERKKEREWRRREVGIGWGKGKGVKKGVMFSFPFVSAWWLQAVDFHLTLLHIVLSLQSVWKLRPQRAEGRGKESKEV